MDNAVLNTMTATYHGKGNWGRCTAMLDALVATVIFEKYTPKEYFQIIRQQEIDVDLKAVEKMMSPTGINQMAIKIAKEELYPMRHKYDSQADVVVVKPETEREKYYGKNPIKKIKSIKKVDKQTGLYNPAPETDEDKIKEYAKDIDIIAARPVPQKTAYQLFQETGKINEATSNIIRDINDKIVDIVGKNSGYHINTIYSVGADIFTTEITAKSIDGIEFKNILTIDHGNILPGIDSFVMSYNAHVIAVPIEGKLAYEIITQPMYKIDEDTANEIYSKYYRFEDYDGIFRFLDISNLLGFYNMKNKDIKAFEKSLGTIADTFGNAEIPRMRIIKFDDTDNFELISDTKCVYNKYGESTNNSQLITGEVFRVKDGKLVARTAPNVVVSAAPQEQPKPVENVQPVLEVKDQRLTQVPYTPIMPAMQQNPGAEIKPIDFYMPNPAYQSGLIK